MPRGEGDSPAARALRAEGFVKLPALWVPAAMRDEIIDRAEKHKARIDWIKANAVE